MTKPTLTTCSGKRDFTKTAEPDGKAGARSSTRLRFVIQKHAATRLHYDLRLELDGVFKSWAVTRGPSLDPKDKRLAVEVEDHPLDYGDFEGTIPKGEYGGGTVMLWDSGTYSIENAGDRHQNAAAHDEWEKGELKLDFHGKRIKGSYVLVRTKGTPVSRSSGKPSWLLIKHRDKYAHPEADSILTDRFKTSVTTGRSMDEIADSR